MSTIARQLGTVLLLAALSLGIPVAASAQGTGGQEPPNQTDAQTGSPDVSGGAAPTRVDAGAGGAAGTESRTTNGLLLAVVVAAGASVALFGTRMVTRPVANGAGR